MHVLPERFALLSFFAVDLLGALDYGLSLSCHLLSTPHYPVIPLPNHTEPLSSLWIPTSSLSVTHRPLPPSPLAHISKIDHDMRQHILTVYMSKIVVCNNISPCRYTTNRTPSVKSIEHIIVDFSVRDHHFVVRTSIYRRPFYIISGTHCLNFFFSFSQYCRTIRIVNFIVCVFHSVSRTCGNVSTGREQSEKLVQVFDD